MDEEVKPKRPEIAVGESLETLSVAELEERIRRLETEIERTRTALTAKRASLEAASSLFRR